MNIYYLYIKTHNQTGLKYLGYTSSKDPHKYKGSGKYWLRHINIHENDVKTEILLESNSLEEIKFAGIYFSELWNIVNNDEFANLKIECGPGGTATPDSIKKGLETKRRNGTLNTNTPESIAKGLETKRKNGTMNANTPEAIAKRLETKRKNGTMNANTPETIAKSLETKRKNGTLNVQTEKTVKKSLETRRKNGTLNTRTKESIIKQKETIKKTGNNNFIKNPPSKQKRLCPYCNRHFSLGNYARWHGENCKLKTI